MKILVNSKQMKECDTRTIEYFKVPSVVLMERAAYSVVEEIEKRALDKGKCLVVCGLGNNGGDGLAVARILYQKGYDITVFCIMLEEKATEQTKLQYEILKQYGVHVTDKIPNESFSFIIDGIFGIGLSRNVEGQWKEIIEKINGMNGYKIAIDIPSGVHGDNGEILGCAFKSDLTVTFAYAKTGLFLFPGYTYAGEVVVKDIGIDKNSFGADCPTTFSYEKNDLVLLPTRKTDSNKGTYGKVLVIAGKHNMAGAAYFSGKAAAMTGCGLVKIATVEENRIILQQLMPEAILETYTNDELISGVYIEKLKESLMWADVLVLGPGLGTEDGSKKLVEAVIRYAKIPMIIDADALNIIAANPDLLKNKKSSVVITPHMGEMARLTGKTIEGIRKDRIRVAVNFAKEYNVICVLKDARTVTVSEDGECYINTSGNHGMATAGAGDVLTGIIAGCIAQGMEIKQAASFGVFLHGMAGDAIVEETGYYSMMATDIIEGIKKITRKGIDHECL